MALTRPLTGTISLILIGASIMFMFFVILGGITQTTPLDKTQFLTADTSSIAGARPVSQWNYFRICGEGNTDCGSSVPALPFGYAWVGGGDGAPSSLLGSHAKNTTSSSYYYMWRFGWVFYLIGLFFTVFAFFASMLALCSRLGSFIGAWLTMVALFFFSIAASLMTAEFVKARNRFHDAGINASLGRYAFGFTWAAWACLAIATILLCIGGAATNSTRRERHRERIASAARDFPVTSATSPGADGGRFGFYRNQRERRAAREAGRRSSFERNESQRRVKDDDYA
ncbi:9aa202d9-4e5b-4990-9262-966e18b5ed7d [Sclerotinia trifoliorum]|uniref:9aa202d9-4e5b-4990-9262-966e18b5ed7d n=1 Tax=Sclerotinia trifoliorum TaxID=28548 RepID=A0A8H2VXY6_9HELO|nr:9aa202d9-4e5b-4990-9262-966e18b5ed7d [Sclerotinia trifoliorum]